MEKDKILLIYDKINIARDNKDKLDFTIKDGVESMFGREYYYVKLILTKKPGINEFINIGLEDTIRFYLGNELPKTEEELHNINRINETNYQWITNLCDLHLRNSGVNLSYYIYPHRIKQYQTV